MHWKTEMLSCIKCHGISAIYSDSRLKEMIKREHCLKQVLQSSSNLRTHLILSPARHLDILKTCIHFGPCWASWVWLVYSWAMNTSSQLKRCLENFKERHFPPAFPTSIYIQPTLYSEPNKTRDGITQLSAMTSPSLAWRKASKICWPKEKWKEFQQVVSFLHMAQ